MAAEEPILINDTAGRVAAGLASPTSNTIPLASPTTSKPNSRSSSRSRLGQAVKAVFSSHAPPSDLSFADSKGLERQARETSSRNASRSNSRAPSPSRAGREESRQPKSGNSSRSSSMTRLGEAVTRVFGGHEHFSSFANEAGMERQARDFARQGVSNPASRSASRSASRARGEAIPEIAEQEEVARGRAEYGAVRA